MTKNEGGAQMDTKCKACGQDDTKYAIVDGLHANCKATMKNLRISAEQMRNMVERDKRETGR